MGSFWDPFYFGKVSIDYSGSLPLGKPRGVNLLIVAVGRKPEGDLALWQRHEKKEKGNKRDKALKTIKGHSISEGIHMHTLACCSLTCSSQ